MTGWPSRIRSRGPGTLLLYPIVLMTTCGASSTIMGAIRRVKSAAPPLAFGSDGLAIGFCGGRGAGLSASGSANAGRSFPAPAPITVAHPSRTKSLRFI